MNAHKGFIKDDTCIIHVVTSNPSGIPNFVMDLREGLLLLRLVRQVLEQRCKDYCMVIVTIYKRRM